MTKAAAASVATSAAAFGRERSEPDQSREHGQSRSDGLEYGDHDFSNKVKQSGFREFCGDGQHPKPPDQHGGNHGAQSHPEHAKFMDQEFESAI